MPLNHLTIKSIFGSLTKINLRSRKLLLYVFVASVSLFVSYLNLSIPQCGIPGIIEYLLFSIHFLLFFGVFGGIKVFVDSGKINMPSTLYMFSLFFLIGPIFFTSQTRMDVAAREHWEFSGEITAKYRSTNHTARTIIVNNLMNDRKSNYFNGRNKIFEFIPEQLWDEINIGDNITKRECDNVVRVNNKNYFFNDVE